MTSIGIQALTTLKGRYIALMGCFAIIALLGGIGIGSPARMQPAFPFAGSSLVIATAGLLLLWRLRRRVVGLVAESERNKRGLLALTTQDEITGALTRRVFLSTCEDEMRRIGKEKRVYALVAIDMDYLKALNDGLGHGTGDFALRHLVKTIRRTFAGAIVGRLGGDEFAIFLPVSDAAQAESLCRNCLDQLRRTEFFEGRPLSLSCSMGIAMTPRHTTFFGELLHHADLALYESKRNGRSRATLFQEEFLQDRRHQRFIERELRAAILLNELSLAYQAIVDTRGSVTGYEALVRWNHPVRGPIPPSDFVPIAEQSLLIDLLGEWVLRRALQDAADFGDLEIGINVSTSQLKRDDIVDLTRRLLAEAGIPARRLVMEVTETVAMSPTPDVLRRLAALRALGVCLSLDDFGTGYCGIAYLKTFPVDSIKIDRSFIERLGTSEADDVIVAALARVAGAMRLGIVAEGIETEEQFRLAKAAGCSSFQGYFIARPTTKDQALGQIFPSVMAA